MMPMKVEEIIDATGGKLVQGNPEDIVPHVSIDTRSIKKGDIFVPLLGEKQDGHCFIKDALKKGAAGAFFSPALYPEDKLPPGEFIFICVDDTLRALQDLARVYRKSFSAKIAAVTGSTGKTTTKDFLWGIINQAHPALKSQGNYNNHIGLPLTLLNLEKEHRAAVVEMGMRAPGEISFLTFLAKPDVGIITNIGESHLEILETKERIARAKGELIYWLDDEKVAILNGDDPFCRKIASYTRAKVFFFGFSDKCHFKAEEKIKIEKDTTIFNALLPGNQRDAFKIPLPGKHHVYNALAAIAAGYILGIKEDEIKNGLACAPLTGMRTEFLQSKYGLHIISDVYNASPSSMNAALEVLINQNARPKIAVLGDMLELGKKAQLFHREVGSNFASAGLDYLVFTGSLREEYKKGAISQGMPGERIYCCKDHIEMIRVLTTISSPGASILLKGSRAMKLEKAVDFLMSFEG